jgi:hypothetical protein
MLEDVIDSRLVELPDGMSNKVSVVSADGNQSASIVFSAQQPKTVQAKVESYPVLNPPYQERKCQGRIC